MKEFIYLDTSFLHSFMAQIHDGLPSNYTSEIQESRTETHADTKTHELSTAIETGINAYFAKIGVKTFPKEISGESVSLVQLDVGKEIISKQLHDNAVDNLIRHLRSKNLIVENSDDVILNNYILYKARYSLVDIEFIKLFTKKEYAQLLGLNKPTPGKPKQASGLLEMEKMLNLLLELLPSDCFIKQDQIISPLKKEYLREQSKELIFKYGKDTEISVLGKVTRKFTSGVLIEDMEFKNILSIQEMMLTVSSGLLSEFGLIEEDDHIVSPIAIFFESV